VTGVSQQLTLSFEPGLTERHKTLLACAREAIYRCKKPLKAVAADMDLSESSLSRKLSENPEDRRTFSLDDLEASLNATNDLTPVYWLIEKYLQDPAHKKARAADMLTRLLPDLIALAREAGISEPQLRAK
jgi:AraC-like DNA-binding protein